MSLGDLVTGLWEFEYRGLKLGGDTEFALVDGNISSLPDIISSDRPRQRRTGDHPGLDFYGGRTLSLVFEIEAAGGRTQHGDAVRRFKQAITGAAPPAPLIFQHPAVGDGTKVSIDVTVRNLDLPSNLEFFEGNSIARLQFRAADPRYYAFAESLVTGLTPPNAIGGRPWPTVWPRQWGTVFTAGTFAVTNNGNTSTSPTFEIEGPCINPSIQHLDTGAILAFNETLTTGQKLIVDVASRSVTVYRQNRYRTIAAGSQWFDLDPGLNSLKFTTADELGTANVRWRSAWT